MRIAVPVNGRMMSHHFGHSSGFLVFEVSQEPPTVVSQSELPVSREGGCQSIPALLAQAEVDVVLAGGMGAGAFQRLVDCGIDAVAGVPDGDPEQVVLDYLHGRLVTVGGLCERHEQPGHGGGNCHEHEHHD